MDLLRTTAIAIYCSLALAAFFVVLAALFPGRLGRTQAMAEGLPGRSFVVGLVNLVFGGAVTIALIALAQWTHLQILGVPAVAVLAAWGVAVALGLGGVVLMVGARLAPDKPGARRTATAALALGWACSVPFLGWFGILPFTAALGLGAFILTFFIQPPRPQ